LCVIGHTADGCRCNSRAPSHLRSDPPSKPPSGRPQDHNEHEHEHQGTPRPSRHPLTNGAEARGRGPVRPALTLIPTAPLTMRVSKRNAPMHGWAPSPAVRTVCNAGSRHILPVGSATLSKAPGSPPRALNSAPRTQNSRPVTGAQRLTPLPATVPLWAAFAVPDGHCTGTPPEGPDQHFSWVALAPLRHFIHFSEASNVPNNPNSY
jgi:hypothetical protein